MRKILFGILLSVLTVFSSFADDITCGPGTEPYTELEYIESSGTQWIDTGYLPDSTSQFELTYTKAPVSKGTPAFMFFGERDANNWTSPIGIMQDLARPNTLPYFLYDGVNNIFLAPKNGGTLRLDEYGLSYNGNLVLPHSHSSFAKRAYSIYLFALNDRGNAGIMTTGYALARFKIYENNIIVRDFVPVRRNSDGAIGMYDKVEGKFYGNSGTGTFIAGPDVGLLLGSSCNVCASGYYNNTGNNTSCVKCPTGYSTTGNNASDHDNINDCKILCGGGYYLQSQYDETCTQVGAGYWIASHTYGYGDIGIRNQCPNNWTTIGFGTGADEVGDCGRKLHVGDDVLYLRSVKKTTPSLNVQLGNDRFYANVSPYPTFMSCNTTHKLRTEYNDKIYSIHDDSSGLYTFDSNGRLVGASDKIYLESSGGQYIDTDFIPNNNSKIDIDYYLPPLPADGYNRTIVGYRFGDYTSTNGFQILGYHTADNSQNYRHIKIGVGWQNGLMKRSNITVDRNHTIIDFKNKTATNNGAAVADASTFINWGLVNMDLCMQPLALFGSVNHDTGQGAGSINGQHRIYSAKFYDNDTLVRDFVPVPAGLKIGDYTVPSNGMWDIVEQKFYGNSGTGDFIYGID